MAVIPSSLRLVKAGTGATRTSVRISWLVKCDATTDTAATVRASSVTPVRGDAPISGLSIPSGYVAWDSDVEPHDDSLYWFKITTEYIVPPLVWFSNPLSYVAKGGGGADYFEDTDYDALGDEIVNTANDFVDPPFQKPVNGGAFWIEFRTTSITGWGERSNVVNSSTVFGLAAGTVRTGTIEWVRGIEDGVRFWQIRVPFFYKPDGWKAKWPSRGFNYLDGTDKKAITLADGTFPSIPQPLDADGATVDDPADAELIETQLYIEANIAGWGLPDPFDLDD